MLREKKESPILIIDDISSYFDSNRKDSILNYLEKRNIQVFISSTGELGINSENFYVEKVRLVMIEIESIGNMIERAIEKSRRLKEGILKAQWKNITGKLSEKSQVLYIKESVLYVAVENSSILHFMEINKKKYINKVNEILNGNIVNDILFRISRLKKMRYTMICIWIIIIYLKITFLKMNI